ncbi:4-hydroxybenzoate octaprenyltransferase [bacterium]|nr:4-hydroxybenzoate octaprenyltransferase [Pelagibacteraceae bacterium]MDC3130824.1 4-hydroxybenzoate octaprenyltransferase [bacterium]
MNHKIKSYILLMRLNSPIGSMLLLYPCLWGLISASSSIAEIRQNIFLFIIFILGAFIMRSAGCVINDIFDRNIDIQVDRTKSRPLADKSISLHESVVIFITLSSIGLCILLSLNTLSIKVGLLSFILLIIYPLTKRITYWPQLFLALTFNIGVLIGYAAITNILPFEIYFLYAAGIFWTLGYDTIYAYQDIDDDISIGVKSTAILFKDSAKYWISSFYILMSSNLLIFGLLSSQEMIYFLLLILILSHQLFQIYKLDIKRPEVCLAIFKSNKYLGLLVCLVLLSNYIN